MKLSEMRDKKAIAYSNEQLGNANELLREACKIDFKSGLDACLSMKCEDCKYYEYHFTLSGASRCTKHDYINPDIGFCKHWEGK